MGARDVKGFVRLGGGTSKSSILIKIEGRTNNKKKGCDLESIRAAIEEILIGCGLKVRSFRVTTPRLARAKKKKK